MINALQASIFVKPVCNTIAFEAIGVEEFCIPPYRAAHFMLEEAINWSTLVHTNGIRHIRLIVEHKHLKMFKNEMARVQAELDEFPRYKK